MKSERYSTLFGGFVTSLVILSTISIVVAAVIHPPTQPTQVNNISQVLHFMAGEHVLGFSPSGVKAATSDHALRVDFVGAENVQPQTQSFGTEGKSAHLDRVQYQGLWQGVDLTYDAPPGGILRSTYQLDVGADVRTIRLRYNSPPIVNNDGSLSIAYETGILNESAPQAWQIINGRQVPVEVSFTQHGTEVGFALGQYDPHYPLTIDPVLTWNTYLGGNSADGGGHAVAVDGTGSIYVGGSSMAAWSCSPTPCTKRPYSGGSDGFVAKLNANGKLLWNTFLGSSGYVEHVFDLALGSDNTVYVTGWGTKDWSGAGSGAFVAKLNATSGVLMWVTFFDKSIGSAISVDGSGNSYVAGQSFGSWGCSYPINCTVRAFTPGTHYSEYDAFVAKFNSNGALQWNTFLGGSGEDWGNAIVLDGKGYVGVVGGSDDGWGSPVRPYNPGDGAAYHDQDTFASKLNASNGTLMWNTFLGGKGSEGSSMIYERYRGIAADKNGNFYLMGDSTSGWSCSPTACTRRPFTVNNLYEKRDAYVAKLAPDGVLKWNTFLGSSSDDKGKSIALDTVGNIYVVGTSDATWGTPEIPFGVGPDAFTAKLNTNGALQWNAFLGKYRDYEGNGITLDQAGTVYVAGVASPPPLYNDDVFVSKISNAVNKKLVAKSISTQDGWVLESGENTSKGGTLNAGATTLRLGDNFQKKQYLSILSFSTQGLPDNAVITKVTLRIKRQSVAPVGTNPVVMFQGFMAEVRKGFFYTSPGLQLFDFQAAPPRKIVGPFRPPLVNGWYNLNLTNAKGYINKWASNGGVTQVRLRFKLDDNNNAIANYLSLYSGNALLVNRPQLVIEYYVP